MFAIAEVILPLALPETLSWYIPEELIAMIRLGQRVEVELGKNKKYSGIVKSLKPQAEFPSLYKPILGIIDDYPIVTETQLKLWSWMAQYFMCSEGEILFAALPNVLKLSSQSIVVYNPENQFEIEQLGGLDQQIFYLIKTQPELSVAEIEKILKVNSITKTLNQFIKHEIVYLKERLEEKYKTKKVSVIQLSPDIANQPQLVPEILEKIKNKADYEKLFLLLLQASKNNNTIIIKDLETVYALKANAGNYFVKKGWAMKSILDISRIHKNSECFTTQTLTLSPQQEQAFQNLSNLLDTKAVCLLHGVTGSGKTEVFIKMIQHKIEQGGQALYLLPEIALTVQLCKRLEKYFGEKVQVYHSKFNHHERAEIWHHVLDGKAQVILGSRSALFLPFTNLKLIIIDEEHDYSYKQVQPNPKYHGKNTAIYLGNLLKIPVILGTATPSFETFYNVQTHKYGFVSLTQRYGNARLPQLEFINLKSEEPLPIYNFFTKTLVDKIQQVLDNKQQVIIFHNRRGYDPYWICQLCGDVPTCTNCNVSLTHHKFKQCLKCHYCNKEYELPNACKNCGAYKFKSMNLGTEKLVEACQHIFQHAKIERMDIDTTKGKYSFDTIISNFEAQKINILVGTQMVVKGLDFKNVPLVAVIDADSLLHYVDFRVNERAFQLLEQVCGRAGRNSDHGVFIIQTRNPNHPILQFVQQHDFKKAYDFDLPLRKLYNYPPYFRLLKISAKHPISNTALQFLNEFLFHFKPNAGLYISKPIEPSISKIKNLFIWELILKFPIDFQYTSSQKQHIILISNTLKKQAHFKSVIMSFDVDFV